MSSGAYSGSGSIDATSYGLNPGVTTDAFTMTLTNHDQGESLRAEASRLAARWGQMDAEAINWKLHWQRSYEYIVPRKEDVIAVRMPGDDRESDIYDTTAVLANEELSAMLHSMLTNPELRFFEILFGDPALDKNPEVMKWCEESADSMYQILNSSNFQTEIHEMYIDLGATGTGCMYMEEDKDHVVRFSARALKEVRFDENHMGMVDVVGRIFKLKPDQILKKFPEIKEKYGRDPEMAADKNPIDQIQILHIVEPVEDVRDEDHRKKVLAKGHKFSSTYMLYDKKFIISQNSYEEFPYMTPRWTKTTGEKYGRGPGFQMLPDIMMLNAMMLTVIQSAQITVGPPCSVEDDAVIGQVRLTPFGLTVIRAGSEPPKPIMLAPKVEFGQQVLEDTRKRIRRGFYVDQMKLPQESPQRTAEEVRQLAEEQLRLMGPVLGRQHSEFLCPMIARLFGMADRAKLIKPPPQVVGKRPWKVRYSSLLARAQRLQEMQNIQRAIATLQPVAQMLPNILDNVKSDDFTKEVLRGFGVPERLITADTDLKKKRAQQAKDMADAKQKMDQQHQSEVAKNTAPLVQAMGQSQQQPGQGIPQGAPGAGR